MNAIALRQAEFGSIAPHVTVAHLPKTCPHCGRELDGEVLVTFNDGKPSGLVQTQRIGRRDYTWLHVSPVVGKCRVLALDRLPPLGL